jgi:hypothetical protein
LGNVISDHNGQLAVAMTWFFGLFLDMNHIGRLHHVASFFSTLKYFGYESFCGLLKVLHFDLEMWFKSIVLVLHSTSCD